MFPGRGALGHLKKIRDCLFSDLSEKREKVYVLYVLYVLIVPYELCVSYCINCIVPYPMCCVFLIHRIHCWSNVPTERSHEQTAFPRHGPSHRGRRCGTHRGRHPEPDQRPGARPPRRRLPGHHFPGDARVPRPAARTGPGRNPPDTAGAAAVANRPAFPAVAGGRAAGGRRGTGRARAGRRRH